MKKYLFIICVIFFSNNCTNLSAKKEIPVYDAQETNWNAKDLNIICTQVIQLLKNNYSLLSKESILLGPHSNNTTEHLPIPELQRLLVKSIKKEFPGISVEIWENILLKKPELGLNPRISKATILQFFPGATGQLSIEFASRSDTRLTEKFKITTIIYTIVLKLSKPASNKLLLHESWSFGKRITQPRVRP